MKKKAWRLFLAGGVSAVAMAGGCANQRAAVGGDRGMDQARDQSPSSEPIDAGGASYERVFDAARETLTDFRFAVDRVDARRGVLTTHPKQSEGLVSPWDREQSTLGQEWEDLANQQERTVRIEFDRGDDDTVFSARVEVLVERVHRRDWRVESESVRLSTHARSRDAMGNIEPREFRETIGHDPALARRIAGAISERLLGN